MTSQVTEGIMYEVLKTRNRVNLISNGFKDIGPVFGTTSLELPIMHPAELGFIRVISWLYVHYFEVGKLGSEFIGTQSDNASVDAATLKNHRGRIQQLRTYCQHNLNYTDSHSKTIQNSCEQWFKSVCGTHLPSEDSHWQSLLESIVKEAHDYFFNLEKILRFIESNEAFPQILDQWQLRISRFYPPHKYDSIIEQVASDWGQDNFDAVKFRKRHYDHWRASFDYRNDEIDFDKEARKIIETAMLADQQDVLPIDGTDVMNEFDIKPGKEVKEVLQLAREMYSANRCTRDALISLLREKIGISKGE